MQGSVGIAVMGASGRMGRMLIEVINDSEAAHLAAVTERPGHDWAGRDLGEAWARLEFEVRDVPHRVRVEQRDGLQADVLKPGVYAVCFPVRDALEVELAATGGAPLAVTVRRLELRSE